MLIDDTGDDGTSYDDTTVEAETTCYYALRARNALRVSPQSAPVTVTTGAAPVEPVIARQVDGADLTLDGETLDTTGTCSESDIASIASGCTINIFDPTVPLAVDGTLDAGAGFSIQIARTGAGTLTASSVASAADFPSDGDSVDVTFPAGRNVLAIFYSGTTHCFRVNVVPYWEWDGVPLSKDSDCQSTTTQTAADITDEDCIVTQFGKTASLRFHNVIFKQFNVNVRVNGSEVITTPDTSALASPFTVNL